MHQQIWLIPSAGHESCLFADSHQTVLGPAAQQLCPPQGQQRSSASLRWGMGLEEKKIAPHMYPGWDALVIQVLLLCCCIVGDAGMASHEGAHSWSLDCKSHSEKCQGSLAADRLLSHAFVRVFSESCSQGILER